MKRIVAIGAVLAVSACAQGPDSIAPATMPSGSYSHLSCAEINQEYALTRSNLDALESKQRGAVAGDAIGVFLIGVPVSSLSGGDKAGDIAVAKGRIIALQQRVEACARAS